MTEEQESRRRFEAWMGSVERQSVRKLPKSHQYWPGQYASVPVQLAWEAWQEAQK